MKDENIGKKYGKLEIIKFMFEDKYYYKHYLCKCECGNYKIININNLRSNKTKSCGCLYKEANKKKFSKQNLYYKKNDYMVGITTNTNKEFYFDEEDYNKIKRYCWYETYNGYIVNKSEKLTLLHRLVTNAPKGLVVDHINHNKRDNRKINLKICTQKENMQNLEKQAKGITKITRNKQVYYIVQLKGKYFGCFKNIQDAENKKKKIKTIMTLTK